MSENSLDFLDNISKKILSADLYGIGLSDKLPENIRHQIYAIVKQFPGLIAYSIGEGPNKYVVIKKIERCSIINVKDMFRKARSNFQLRNYSEALDIYLKILTFLNRPNADLFGIIGECYLRMNNIDAAITYLSAATIVDPIAKNYSLVIKDLKSGHQMKQNDFLNKLKCTEKTGISLFGPLAFDEKEQLFDIIMKEFPNYKINAIGYGSLLHIVVRDFENGHNNCHLIDISNGNRAMRDGEIDLAIDYYKRALKYVDSPLASLYGKLGICLLKKGLKDEAIPYLKVATIKEPESKNYIKQIQILEQKETEFIKDETIDEKLYQAKKFGISLIKITDEQQLIRINDRLDYELDYKVNMIDYNETQYIVLHFNPVYNNYLKFDQFLEEGNIAYQFGRYHDAIKILKRYVIAKSNLNGMACSILGLSHLKTGNEKVAIDYLKIAIASNIEQFSYLVDLVNALDEKLTIDEEKRRNLR